MRLRAISPSAVALLAAVLVAGCKEQSPISHAPTSILVVSGSNQSANVSTALDSLLVVRVVDGTNKPVSGVALAWTAIGGGSLSATSTTTGDDGTSSVKWTLAPTSGNQVVLVTSTQIAGAQASFVANNGATISGVITTDGARSPFATFNRAASARPQFALTSASASGKVVPRYVPGRLIVGMKSGTPLAALSVSSSRSDALRTQSMYAVVAQRLVQGRPLSVLDVSPALAAARIEVTDTTKLAALADSLRADPSVAYVEREGIRTIPTRLVSPSDRVSATLRLGDLASGPLSTVSSARGAVATTLPNDANFFIQYWNYNMLDLPRAWTSTTGSANVVVAVVDQGIRFDATTIAGNLTHDGYDFVSNASPSGFTGPQPICGGGTFTSVADDGDGPDPDPTAPDDFDGYDATNACWVRSSSGDHGLWTASIIGESGNDGVGGTGINWTVRIRPIRVLGVTGEGSDFDIAQGILYAAGLPATGAGGAVVQTTKAPIINMSLGGYGTNATLANAVSQAVAAGCLIVAAAGNDQTDLASYPASYPGVMSVSAVAADGTIASYSNAGTSISVAAPGGDIRLDDPINNGTIDNGGSWIWGLWWDFTRGRAVFNAAIGTSAAAPHVSGIAALLLAKNPSMSATDLRSRIEQTATRRSGAGRNDVYGWGIVNAYAALSGAPAHHASVRLVDATTGALVAAAPTDATGAFALTKLHAGSYYLQAGEDDSGDGLIGVPGRRFGAFGGSASPSPLTVGTQSQGASFVVGMPMESEPNDSAAVANVLPINSYVVGTVGGADARDVYRIAIPTAGTYTFETSGLVGLCGFGLEVDTVIQLASAAGVVAATNDNVSAAARNFCSRIQVTLIPGTYYLSVFGTSVNGLSAHGRYRLEARAGN